VVEAIDPICTQNFRLTEVNHSVATLNRVWSKFAIQKNAEIGIFLCIIQVNLLFLQPEKFLSSSVG
jgi:hypothetical protein